MVFGFDDARRIETVAVLHRSVAPAIQAIPASRITGPEPPPPRA